MNLLLLDVRPDPVSVAGPVGLILLALVVLMITVALVVGFVFLLKRLRRNGGNPASVGRSISSGAPEQPQPNNPNQP
jgi:hypothetical protein